MTPLNVLKCERLHDDGHHQFADLTGTCLYNNSLSGSPGIYLSKETLDQLPPLEDAVFFNKRIPKEPEEDQEDVNTESPEETRKKDLLSKIPTEWTPIAECEFFYELTEIFTHSSIYSALTNYSNWQNRERSHFEKKRSRVLCYKLNQDDEYEEEVLFCYKELGRYEDSLYTKLPEKVLVYLESINATPPEDHYIHVSRNNKICISYTESHKHGEADRQTSVKIGKYLRRHFDHLTDPEIAVASSLYRKEQLGDIDVKFARSRAEIKHVYENGPSSCMSHHTSHYITSGIHPCEIYATNDCSVAYIERDGRITARTVINEVRKEYVRIYGDEIVLTEGLQDLGYKEGNLDGCSLLLLRTNSDLTIAPYLDGDCTSVNVLSDKIVVAYDGDREMLGQYGLIEQDMQRCDECGEGFDSDKMSWSDYHDISICSSCIDEFTYAYYDSYSNITYIRNSEETFYAYKYDYYTCNALESHGLRLIDDEVYSIEDDIVFSEIDSEWYLLDDVQYYMTYSGDLDCTRTADLIQPEDEEYHMLEEDCYEFNGLYYRYESNKMEVEHEFNTEREEESKEVA